MVFVEGIAVSGEFIDTLDNKEFEIIKAPHYIELPDLENPSLMKKKVIMEIRLSDGSELSYYPNKSSLKTMTSHWGYEMDNWLGKRFQFYVSKQKVMGTDKKVLFILEKRIVNGKN